MWLRSRRRAERSVDETTRRLVKSIGADEPSLGPDPIEELVRIVGESDPCPWGDARFRQTSSRRARPNRRGYEVSPDQCRQARDTLKWTPGELAGAAGVTPWVVTAFEDEREVSPADEAAIRATLEAV